MQACQDAGALSRRAIAVARAAVPVHRASDTQTTLETD